VYKTLIRPILFLIPPESVHSIIVKTLRFFYFIGLTKLLRYIFFSYNHHSLTRNVFGIEFKNPVGLAAGFDKDANLIDIFDDFGFGFIEIGTLTPRAQPGNPKPRLFRLIDDQALINRMGFNNKGTDEAIHKLKSRKSRIIVGGNIGKNKTTPNDQASKDYLYCLNALYDYVDYFVVNISSPNTPDLRELQSKEPLQALLKTLQDEINKRPDRKPLLLKIAPDLSDNQLIDIVNIVNSLGLDGIVATNTTISREGLKTEHEKIKKIDNGGLSGQPLREKSTEIIRFLGKKLNKDIPIIGVGGIMNERDAIEKMEAGAALVQVYTGFIYEGPALIKNINKALVNRNFD
jgi:dihydroorotate dehydrogenase